MVGAPRGDHLGLTDSGYALVGFLESNGTMIRVAKLSSPNPSADNKFGNDVLINGNFISVLSRGENSIHFWEFDRGQKSVSYKGAVSLSGALNKFEGRKFMILFMPGCPAMMPMDQNIRANF